MKRVNRNVRTLRCGGKARLARSSDVICHHNLARELGAAERYDPLIASLQLCSIGPDGRDRFYCSSEDFEFLYCKPMELDVLRASWGAARIRRPLLIVHLWRQFDRFLRRFGSFLEP